MNERDAFSRILGGPAAPQHEDTSVTARIAEASAAARAAHLNPAPVPPLGETATSIARERGRNNR